MRITEISITGADETMHLKGIEKRNNKCCPNEKRNMNGGCINCGDPSY